MIERKPFECNGTFDIECWDWQNFAIGATYDGRRPRVWYDGDEMIDHLRTVGGIYFAHAGGVYDLLYVLERARARGISCQVDRSQHRVTRIVMGRLTLRDSYALWPVPLDDICGALGRPVPHLPWACICGRKTCSCGCGGCGGYCRIMEKANEGDPDLEDYVKADCVMLYDGLQGLDTFTSDHKIALRGTLGQTAWVAAQDELGLPDSDIPWHLWRAARRGDKGGRAAIIRPYTPGPGSHHDICNAYPGQLAKAELPVGRCRELGDKHAQKALAKCRPGIYTVTVNVPETLFLPPLPWSKAGMLTFPTGEFSGSWALPELVAAFERGVTVKKIHGAVVWQSAAAIFGELMQRWYDIRRAAGRKTPFGQWVGRFAKAVTGKFAERPDRNRVTMHPESIKVCLGKGPCRKGCTKRCGAYEQLDLDGFIYAIPYSRLGPSAYPQWSAYLRALTRIQWMEQAERFGEDLVMGNTDSLWTIGRKKPEPLGDDLGQWEYQHDWCELEIRSIGCYAWRDLPDPPVLDPAASLQAGKPVYEQRPGRLHVRGIPGITEEDWKRGHGVIDRGVTTFGRGVKSTKGLFRKRHRRWTLPGKERAWFGDRLMGARGVTWPVDAQLLRELERKPTDPATGKPRGHK